jgi:hypothetical protein
MWDNRFRDEAIALAAVDPSAGISILNQTDENNPIDDISRIETQLEELAEVSERCRKIILISKAAIAGGVALLLFMLLGLFGSNQVAAIGSIGVVLGGIVSLGSNVSTLQQTMAAMSAAEALRSDLISRIDLRVVGDRKLWNGFDVIANHTGPAEQLALRLV